MMKISCIRIRISWNTPVQHITPSVITVTYVLILMTRVEKRTDATLMNIMNAMNNIYIMVLSKLVELN